MLIFKAEAIFHPHPAFIKNRGTKHFGFPKRLEGRATTD
jgi:hypothetical protein